MVRNFSLAVFAIAVFSFASAFAQVASPRVSVNAFQNVLSRPTVSPYLQLVQNNGNGQIGRGSIYQTQVRPQIEARQRAKQQQQQIKQVQQQLNTVRRDYQSSTGGRMSTGHPTRFMSYSHYYPSLGR